MSPYSFSINSPITFLDPNGMEVISINGGVKFTGEDAKNAFISLQSMYGNSSQIQPEKSGAITIDKLISNLKGAGVSNLKGMKEYYRLASFQQNYNSGKSNGEGAPWNYVYTQGVGWIDITHFINAALSLANPLLFGELTESYQTMSGQPSAWSYEDLQSNLQGALFAKHHGVKLKGESFYKALKEWFNGLFAAAPEEAPNWNDLPPNEKQATSYGDNGNGQNAGKPIPINSSYVPIFAPCYSELNIRYKYLGAMTLHKNVIIK